MAIRIFDAKDLLEDFPAVLGYRGWYVGPTNDSGVASRPTRNDSEKFSVARVARNMPKSKSEKQCKSTTCCFEGDVVCMPVTSNGGSTALTTAVTCSKVGSA